MKRMLQLFFCIVVIFLLATSSALAQEAKVITLELDGQVIPTDVAPALIQDRTLIPGRALFEAMGGTVGWDGASQMVTVMVNGYRIQLTINSKIALVDQVEVELDVPAQLVNNRTMIPLRFVAEQAECKVQWDGSQQVVRVTSPSFDNISEGPTDSNDTVIPPAEVEPEAPEIATVEKVKMEVLNDSYQLTITADGDLSNYNTASSNSERFVLDIDNATILVTPKAVDGNNPLFESLQIAPKGTSGVTITLDLSQAASGSTYLSSDNKTLTVSFPQVVPPTGFTPVQVADLPLLDERAADKLVVIDAGHGGSQPGSKGVLGNTTLIEKDVNLDVALRVEKLLQQAGVRTYMIRSGDETVETMDRPRIANLVAGDIFLCIHNNAFEQGSSPNGTETLWFDGTKNTEATYGITSKRLAQIAQEQMLARLGLTDRKIKERSDLIVLKYTDMPAYLIEGAFLTNESDMKYMLTDEFREQFALAAAYSVIQGLNESVQ